MGSHRGTIETLGPIIEVRVMASPERVMKLKASGRDYPEPSSIRALIDTGASGTAVDTHVLSGLNLLPTGSVCVHTPSTGPAGEMVNEYDVSLVLGAGQDDPRIFTVAALSMDLASGGFFALIGWDILCRCTLVCTGPAKKFTLRF